MGAIEDWINSHPSKNLDDPFLVLGNGKTLTLKEVLSEVRLQTDMGKKFRKDLIKLTIDLLVRKKEKLND